MSNRQGQGLSLTTIIIAAIGLIVLVVLVAIFTGQIGQFGIDVGKARELQACPNPAGCVSATSCKENEEQVYAVKCDTPGQICCIVKQ